MAHRHIRPISDDPIELIKWLAAQQVEHIHVGTIGEISSVDPQHWVAKVKLLPDNVETGWLPLPSTYAGNGYGIWGLPDDGTQVFVIFEGADYNLGKIVCYVSNLVDTPPQLSQGQLNISNAAGAKVLLDTDGSVIVNDGTKAVVLDGDEVSIDINGTTYTGTVKASSSKFKA